MAPDTVVSLVQGANQVGARIRQRKTMASANVGERVDRDAVLKMSLYRHQALKVEFPGYLEQHARSMLVLSLRCMHGPGRVAQSRIEPVRVGAFILEPCHDLTGELQFAEAGVKPGDELRFEPRAVEPGGSRGLIGVDRLALHEQPLA